MCHAPISSFLLFLLPERLFFSYLFAWTILDNLQESIQLLTILESGLDLFLPYILKIHIRNHKTLAYLINYCIMISFICLSSHLPTFNDGIPLRTTVTLILVCPLFGMTKEVFNSFLLNQRLMKKMIEMWMTNKSNSSAPYKYKHQPH